jgi:hypothetical protein
LRGWRSREIRYEAHDALPGKNDNGGSGALGINTPELIRLHHQEEHGDIQDLHLQGKGTTNKASLIKGRGSSCARASRRYFDADHKIS